MARLTCKTGGGVPPGRVSDDKVRNGRRMYAGRVNARERKYKQEDNVVTLLSDIGMGYL